MTQRDDRSHTGGPGAIATLEVHVDECADCRATPPPVDRIAAMLQASAVAVDAAALSRHTLMALRPELARRAAAALWRKVAVALLLALLPLPMVLAYDAYVLRMVYDVVSALVPQTIAVYLIGSYAAFLVLLFATTYAAIPLLVAQHSAARRPNGGQAALV